MLNIQSTILLIFFITLLLLIPDFSNLKTNFDFSNSEHWLNLIIRSIIVYTIIFAIQYNFEQILDLYYNVKLWLTTR